MDKATPRPIFVSFLVGTLCLYSFSLAWDNRTLTSRNERLIQQSQVLGRALEKASAVNQAFSSTSAEEAKAGEEREQTLDSLRRQNESFSFQLQKIEAQTKAAKEEKSYLEEMLINKTKEIEILRSEGGSRTVMSIDENGVRQEIGERDGELQRLNDQNRVLQEKMEKLFKTTNEQMSGINVAKIALAESVSTAQQKIEDEWNTVNLGAVTTSAMPSRQNDIEEAPVPHIPKTEGHVLAINNEHGFVVVDLGKVDNLRDSETLEVSRDGVPVATLSVLEIRDVMAACNIKDVQDGQRIEINDPVSIVR
jgi:hypothetical protein